MITILGDKVKLTLPEVSNDITLFLDITGHPINCLFTKNPAYTYVVTTKTLEQCKDLISLGFYNLIYAVAPKDVTQRLLATFIATDYEDNRIKIVIDNLIPLYNEYGTVVNCIAALLESIKTCNLGTYSKIVKFNLATMQEAIKQIETMYNLANSFYENKDQLLQMREAVSNTNMKESEIGMYKSKIEELLMTVENTKHDIFTLTEQYKEAQKQIAELTTRELDIQTIHKHPAYKSIDAENKELSAKLSELEEEYKKLQLASGLIPGENTEGMDTKDKIIQGLRQDLLTMQTLTWDQRMERQLPAVTGLVSLAAQHTLYLKEIKPAVYINSLIFWLNTYCGIKLRKEQNKAYLILVFDPLINQFSRMKYAKRGWAMNSVPNAGSSVVITNEVNLNFLKNTLKIHEYDFLCIIDRFGLMKDVFDTKILQKYYFIDTVNDIIDYKLDASRCIGFFDLPAGAPQPCRFMVSPSNPGLSIPDTAKRSFKIHKDQVMTEILKEIGVVEDV